MWYILCVVTWSPVKSKIIKQRSNIFEIDSVVSTKLFPEPQERSSKIKLIIIGSVLGTVLLENVYWWELTGLLTVLFLCHIGRTSALLVMKMFLLNLSKSNSKELLMIEYFWWGWIKSKYFDDWSIFWNTFDGCWLFEILLMIVDWSELLLYCISKIYRKPHNIRNSRPCELFRSCSLKCPRSPICNSSKAEILLRRNI